MHMSNMELIYHYTTLWIGIVCSKTCLATVLIRSIYAREKLHERFSAKYDRHAMYLIPERDQW